MENHRYIVDQGLFLGKEFLDNSLLDSFETISNLLKTIKEYRDYAHPDSPSWEEYILEIFHLVGFKTENQSPQLITLSEIGTGTSPTAVVRIIRPNDAAHYNIPDPSWFLHLSETKILPEAEWGIVTDGFLLMIFPLQRTDYQQNYFWADIESIIKFELTDSFLTLYKVLSSIRNNNRLTLSNLTYRKPERRGSISSYPKNTYDLQDEELATGYIELFQHPRIPSQKGPTKADCEGFEYISMVQLCNIAQDNQRSRSSACRAFGGDKGDVPVIPERQARVSYGHSPWKFVLVSALDKYFSEVGIDW